MVLEQIVIIGAGFAGLAAGYMLSEQGHLVEVYEARGRIGGRVQSIYVDGRVAEVGGQNITDGGDAPCYRYFLDKFGLKTHKATFSNPFYGTLNIDVESLRGLAKNCKTMQELIDKADIPETKLLMAGIEGLDPKFLSIECLPTLEMIFFDNPEQYFESVLGGNVQLAEHLAANLKVHLNCPLKKIEKKGARYSLHFEDKEVLADRVILTLPTTIYNQVEFSEDVLPRQRVEAISSIAFGTNGKILIPIDGVKGDSPFSNNGRVATFTTVDRKILTLYYTHMFGDFTEKTIEEVYAVDKPHAAKYFELASNQPPELIRDENFSKYKGPAAKSWINDPYARGSYSTTGAGQEAIFTEMVDYKGFEVKKVFEPYQGIFFAGEATCSLLEIDGTMEAALESGIKAAKIICSY